MPQDPAAEKGTTQDSRIRKLKSSRQGRIDDVNFDFDCTGRLEERAGSAGVVTSVEAEGQRQKGKHCVGGEDTAGGFAHQLHVDT